MAAGRGIQDVRLDLREVVTTKIFEKRVASVRGSAMMNAGCRRFGFLMFVSHKYGEKSWEFKMMQSITLSS